MCGICGCSDTNEKSKITPTNTLAHPFVLKHHHEHKTDRLIQVEQAILSKNNQYAKQNRAYFQNHNIFAINLVSSPGAGKTTLLVKTIEALKDKFPIAVIEGDQQTERDAEKIRATGVPAIQINTGRGCHLEAQSIAQTLGGLALKPGGLLAIENVGNLVCPASFDLGEAYKIVVLSVTEGDDKPLKYPDMFHAAKLMILTKTDLLPYVDFDVNRCVDYAKQVNSSLEVIKLSSTTGYNFNVWLEWLTGQIDTNR